MPGAWIVISPLRSGILAPALGTAVSTSKSSSDISKAHPQLPCAFVCQTSGIPSSLMRIPLTAILFIEAMASCASFHFGQTRKCSFSRCIHRPMYLHVSGWREFPIFRSLFPHPCFAFR